MRVCAMLSEKRAGAGWPWRWAEGTEWVARGGWARRLPRDEEKAQCGVKRILTSTITGADLFAAANRAALEFPAARVFLHVDAVFVLRTAETADFPDALIFSDLPPPVLPARPSLPKTLETHAVTPFTRAHSGHPHR